MNKQSNEFLDRHALEWSYSLAYTTHPSSHLTRRVDIMRLLIDSETLLRQQIKLNHGIRQRLSVHTQRWNYTQHGTIKRTVDLLK